MVSSFRFGYFVTIRNQSVSSSNHIFRPTGLTSAPQKKVGVDFPAGSLLGFIAQLQASQKKKSLISPKH